VHPQFSVFEQNQFSVGLGFKQQTLTDFHRGQQSPQAHPILSRRYTWFIVDIIRANLRSSAVNSL
jgi:hypothetical protein